MPPLSARAANGLYTCDCGGEVFERLLRVAEAASQGPVGQPNRVAPFSSSFEGEAWKCSCPVPLISDRVVESHGTDPSVIIGLVFGADAKASVTARVGKALREASTRTPASNTFPAREGTPSLTARAIIR